MTPIILLMMLLSASVVEAQTWSDLQSVQKNMNVRVFEAAGKRWTFADGKLLLVKDDDLTILRGRRPVVIPKAVISKVEARRRDPPIEGALLGALLGIGVMYAGAGQGCTSTGPCVAGAMLVYGGLGALMDWRIVDRRTVYKAP